VANSYIGEIRMFGGNFAPAGWMFCNGQLLPIAEYDALFNLIGTTYGGDGQSTFALPNLQGRVPLHQGQGFTLGQPGGSEQVTLTAQQAALHSHTFQATAAPGAQRNPSGNTVATIVAGSAYSQQPATAPLAPQSISPVPGGSAPHDNLQPCLCLSFIISLYGIYPTPT